MTDAELADIRGNIRIYDNRVAERDVMKLLKEIDRLRSALIGAQHATALVEEVTDYAISHVEGVAHKLRKMAGYVEGPYPPLERS